MTLLENLSPMRNNRNLHPLELTLRWERKLTFHTFNNPVQVPLSPKTLKEIWSKSRSRNRDLLLKACRPPSGSTLSLTLRTLVLFRAGLSREVEQLHRHKFCIINHSPTLPSMVRKGLQYNPLILICSL